MLGIARQRLDPDRPEGKSKYRRAEVRLAGLRAIIMEGHESGFDISSGPLDICGSASDALDERAIANLPEPARELLYSFYVEDWNSCICVAAERAELRWIGN